MVIIVEEEKSNFVGVDVSNGVDTTVLAETSPEGNIKTLMTIEEQKFKKNFPNFVVIEQFSKPVQEQLFSYRNGYSPVIPTIAVKHYLDKHCIEKSELKRLLYEAFDLKTEEPWMNVVQNSELQEMGVDTRVQTRTFKMFNKDSIFHFMSKIGIDRD